MVQQKVYRHGEVKLTGIKKLRNKYKDQVAVICCSGTTFERYDDSVIPKEWKRFAINEAVRKLQTSADFWVLSDDPIVLEYAKFCPKDTKVLCMHEGTKIIRRHCTAEEIYTVESMSKIRHYDNGFEFFSRGTVMIGAIEMARYMGFKTFYIFGHDCYRLKSQYYYDNRKPIPLSENNCRDNYRVTHRIPPGHRIYVTPRLRAMIGKLDTVKEFGLWNNIDIWCVDSPVSQQKAIPKMDIEEFHGKVKEWQSAKSDERPSALETSPTTLTVSASSSSSTQPPTSPKKLVLKGNQTISQRRS
jgi:hypothetical protein